MPSAKTIVQDGDVVTHAKECEAQLRGIAGTSAVDPVLADRCKAVQIALAEIIQATADAARMEELLALNDSITTLLAGTLPATPSVVVQSVTLTNGKDDDDSAASLLSSTTTDSAVDVGGGTVLDIKANGGLKLQIPASHDHTAESDAESELEVEEVSPGTPKIDKGKGRAEPEPEVHEPVLSPSFRISGSDDEDEEGKLPFVVDEPQDGLGGPSPTDL